MAIEIKRAEHHEKKWGFEAWFANSELYCGKVLTVDQKQRCSIHHHKIKHETFFVIDGEIFIEIEGEEFYLLPGDSVTLPPNTRHRFSGVAHRYSRFVECSTQHFEEDSYRDTESGPVPEDEWERIWEGSTYKKMLESKE